MKTSWAPVRATCTTRESKTPAEFANSIGDPELSVVEWARTPKGATTALPQTSFAGVAGALAGAS